MLVCDFYVKLIFERAYIPTKLQVLIQQINKLMEERLIIKRPITENTLDQEKVLGEEESYAYLAYKIIQFIMKQEHFGDDQAAQKSIRERILYLIDTQQKINQTAKDKMRAFFDFKINQQKKLCYNKQIFRQSRFENASYKKGSMVFNPTKTTFEVFGHFISQPRKNILLYGNSGIGKTISICLMVNLFKIVTDYRISKQTGLRLYMKNRLIEEEKFNKIPKVFYIEVSKYLNDQACLKSIASQTHMNLDQRILYNYLEKLKEYYKKQKMNVVFAIDQINIYYSLLRKILLTQNLVQKGLYQSQIVKITIALDQLKESNISIIYSSSPNFQYGLAQKVNNKYEHKFNCQQYMKETQTKRIPYQAFRQSYSGFYQMLHTIFFQYKNLLKKKQVQSFEGVDKKIKQFLNQGWLQDFLKKIKFSSSGQLTHLRISQYFDFLQTSSIKQLLKLFETLPLGKDVVLQNFLSKIQLYTTNQSILKYKNFVSKGDAQIISQKYLFLLFLKQKTIQMMDSTESTESTGSTGSTQSMEIIENSKSIGNTESMEIIEKPRKIKSRRDIESKDNRCIIKLNENEFQRYQNIFFDFSYLINNENAIIGVNQKKIQIFYSPLTFVNMVESIQQDFRFINDNLKNFLCGYGGQSQALCGIIFDKCCTTLISHFQAQFKLCGNSHYTKNLKPLSFVHINEKKDIPNPKEINSHQKFGELFDFFKEEQQQLNQNQYFGAYPIIVNNNVTIKYSGSSRCIDCLLITKKDKKFCFKTIDFSVSSNKTNLKQKIKRADKFFTHLSDKMKDFESFQFEHYFVLRKDMCQEFQNIMKKYEKTLTVKFFASAIEQLDIKITNPNTQLRNKLQFQLSVYDGIIRAIKGSK